MQQYQPSLHWQFPAAAKFGRIIPKEKLYEQTNANAYLKQLFVEQVAQIKWAYKLAENTINLSKTQEVEEIEIIQIKLKTHTLDEKILTAMDKVIPHPTVFMLIREQQQGAIELAYKAAHKQKTQQEKWQHSQYLQSAWLQPESKPPLPLPPATNLQGLYHQLLEALMPQIDDGLAHHLSVESKEENKIQETQSPVYELNLDEESSTVQTINRGKQGPSSKRTLEQKLAALAEISALDKKLSQIKNKRDKEKQFNRRLALNDQFKTLALQLKKLKAL